MLLVAACNHADARHSQGWPTADPVVVAYTGLPSSHPPGATSSEIARCTGSRSPRGQLHKAKSADPLVTVADGRQPNAVTMTLPTEYLPVRLAHMPAFDPKVCLSSTTRHGKWSRVTVIVLVPQPATVATNDAPTSWLGRPLVTLG